MTTASKDAYVAIVDKLPKKRAAVFAAIGNSGGSTIREACAHLAWPHTTVSARIHELAEAGLIKGTSFKRDGQTVWLRSQPEEVEERRAERKASKRYETNIIGWHGEGGPANFGPDQDIIVQVKVPRKVWNTFKGTVRVRFL